MEEKCNCCHKQQDEKENWHLFIPDVGYGSLFDRIEPDKPIQMTICKSCFEQMNRWLKKKYPEINLQDFWRFKIIDKSEDYNLPKGYIREIMYERQLYELISKFMPDVYFGENINPIKKITVKIKNYIKKARY